MKSVIGGENQRVLLDFLDGAERELEIVDPVGSFQPLVPNHAVINRHPADAQLFGVEPTIVGHRIPLAGWCVWSGSLLWNLLNQRWPGAGSVNVDLYCRTVGCERGHWSGQL